MPRLVYAELSETVSIHNNTGFPGYFKRKVAEGNLYSKIISNETMVERRRWWQKIRKKKSDETPQRNAR